MGSLETIGGLHYDMMRRCYNEKNVAYKSYGAKGITVCPEWHDKETFRKWCLDNGWEKGLRLNRINGSKNYCPENCFFGNHSTKREDSYKQTQIKKRIAKNRKKLSVGICGNLVDDELYTTYHSMHSRCECKTHDNYKYYGARGISVCDEWSGEEGFFTFKKWCNDNKWRKGLTIERIDVNGNYCPENCRLATLTEQSYNKSSTIYYDYCGISMPLGMIAKIENVKYGLLYGRVRKNGMTVSEALADIKQKYS